MKRDKEERDLFQLVRDAEEGRIVSPTFREEDEEDTGRLSRDNEIIHLGGTIASPVDVTENEARIIRDVGVRAYDQAVRAGEANLPVPDVYCTHCGAEIDPDRTLNNIQRANARRCEACLTKGPKLGLKKKFCRSCGEPFSFEQYLAENLDYLPPEQRAARGKKGWPTWSTHKACKTQARTSDRTRRLQIALAARQAREAAIAERVRSVADPKIREELAQRFHVQL